MSTVQSNWDGLPVVGYPDADGVPTDVFPLPAEVPVDIPEVPGRHRAEHFESEPPAWAGQYLPYSVGEPGRAATEVVSVPDPENWHRRDSVIDGFVVRPEGGPPLAEVRAASLRGLSHRAYGRTRQDEYAYQLTPDGRHLVLCVADGLSSGSWSHYAAEVAARTGVTLLVNALAHTEPAELDWDRLMREVAGHIVAFARKRVPGGAELEVSEVAEWMSTTAVYAVAALGDEVMDVHVGSVGDSSAWVLAEPGWVPMADVKNADADVHSSAVGALPLVPAQPVVRRHAQVAPGEVLVLMSDGVGDPLHNGTGEVGRFLAHSWRNPPDDLAFAAQVGFHKRSYDDDRTVVAVWPLPRLPR
ncbi:PP2C family serine/threonine-protein phosphatase [Amycolatopsis sp. lyj-109]|uniref:PP2C family serine/threonine-protein phosphatase n=1 Tax=Amycolatopsis sp. lyj-109 TaxID=2789287 RepID=UPI00397DB49A